MEHHYQYVLQSEKLLLANMSNNKAYIPLLSLILFSGFFFLKTIKLSSCYGDLNVGCMQIEKESLLKFKKSLTDASGQLSSWAGEDCCKWSGIVCNNRTGHVVKLKLRNPFPDSFDADGTTYHLGGKINSSLLDLKYLNYLDLSSNNFGGSEIPKFLGSLNKLRYLNLSGASFRGTIPPHIGNLSNLRYLDLHTNFDGSIETNLQWLSSLSSLKHLNLGGVSLSKAADYWLQAINMLPSLLELHLPACGLSKLPLSLPFVNFSSLLVLDLSNNDFNSSIPHWLFNVRKLAYLNLNSNYLHGTIPDAFANLTSLEKLDLSENNIIGGQLSRNLRNLCSLRILYLSQNNFNGEITELIDGLSRCTDSRLEKLDLAFNELGGFLPYSLGYLKNLKHLDLMENTFLGSIPNSIGNLSSLKEFYLSNNQMNGTIPESLGQLSALVVLDLSDNSWVSVVTEAHLLNLTSLKELSIAKFIFPPKVTPKVTLVFNVSSQWIPPFKLRLIELQTCQLGPKFPAWLRNQNELKTIILRNALISDTIPEWFWKFDLQLDELDLGYNQLSGRVPNSLKFNPLSTVFLNGNCFDGPLPLWSSNVSELYLNYNFFSGPIPVDIGERMPMLTALDLSHNSLNGTIPLSIGKLSDLMVLVISNNHFSGKFPGFWNDLPILYALDMSNNNISGEIPSSLCSQSSLKFLWLSNNHLSGEFPSALQNCPNIYTLDIGDNKLSGKIPAWIGERMPHLLILRLRSNFFEGNVPSQLCSLSSLHILDLAHNNLWGSIPFCVGNLSGMVLDLNNVRYEGQLQVVLKGREFLYQDTLYLVNSIDLSSNNLSGEVPEELSNLSRLGTLNLSINYLTGKIPQKIGSLQRLETLDLSRNQLSGAIPPSMTSLTALNHLNLSYNNLSGEIPSRNQFQTLNDPSIYEGNLALCGLPLTTKCNCDDEPSSPPSKATENKDDEDGDEFEMTWFYISMGPGFVVGFWGVCGTLIIKKSRRYAYFRFVDDMIEGCLWLSR